MFQKSALPHLQQFTVQQTTIILSYFRGVSWHYENDGGGGLDKISITVTVKFKAYAWVHYGNVEKAYIDWRQLRNFRHSLEVLACHAGVYRLPRGEAGDRGALIFRCSMLPVALDGEGLQESVGGKTWLGERDSTAVSFHKGRVC